MGNIGVNGKGKGLPITCHEGPEGEQMYSSTLPSTSAIDGWVVSTTPRPLYPPGQTRYPLYWRLGGPPGPVWTGAENLVPPPTGIRSPARSESLYRLRYPGPPIRGVPALRCIFNQAALQPGNNSDVN